MHNNFQERIIAILRLSPNGLTSNEIAELLTAKNMSSRLSTLAAYGIIGKVRHSCGPRANVYRALPYEKIAGWSAPSGLTLSGELTTPKARCIGERLFIKRRSVNVPTLPNHP
jgi:hypothetical protein